MSKASSKTNLNSSKPLENGTQVGVDWGSSAVPAPSWGGNDSGAGFDWSQPVTKGEDDELKLDWGNDKDEDVEDDDEDDGLTMKKPDPGDGGSESGGAKLQRENSQVGIKYVWRRDSVKNNSEILVFLQGESEVDVIAEQLKFRACLKILMTELRTLATGFEVDGGKLRFQLYSWLEKEIAAMHNICNYKVNFSVLCICT